MTPASDPKQTYRKGIGKYVYMRIHVVCVFVYCIPFGTFRCTLNQHMNHVLCYVKIICDVSQDDTLCSQHTDPGNKLSHMARINQVF